MSVEENTSVDLLTRRTRPTPRLGSSGGSRSSGGGSGSSARPRWSPAGSSVVYAPVEVRALTPIRETPCA